MIRSIVVIKLTMRTIKKCMTVMFNRIQIFYNVLAFIFEKYCPIIFIPILCMKAKDYDLYSVSKMIFKSIVIPLSQLLRMEEVAIKLTFRFDEFS